MCSLLISNLNHNLSKNITFLYTFVVYLDLSPLCVYRTTAGAGSGVRDITDGN